MAIIYSYPLVTSIQPSDLLILSVDSSELPTRQVTVGDLLASGAVDVNLNFTADTGTGSVNLSTQSLEVRQGVYITTTATNQELIINHKSTVRQDTNIGDTSPGYGGSFTVIDSVVTDATGSGHVTGVNLKTVTLPAADDTNTTYDLLGYNTGIELVGSDNTRDQIQIVGSGGTTVSQANNIITVSSTQDTDNYVDGGTYSGDTLTLERTGGLGDIDISGFLEIGSSASQALAGNTTTITQTQADDIIANNAKVSFPEAPTDGQQYARQNSSWSVVSSSGGTVTSVTTGDSNTITIGGTAADPTVAANTAAVTNGSLNLATGDQIYDFVINQGYTTNTGTVTDFDTISTAIPGITTAVTNSTTTPELTISITGTPTSSQYLDGTGNWSTPAGGGGSVTGDGNQYNIPVWNGTTELSGITSNAVASKLLSGITTSYITASTGSDVPTEHVIKNYNSTGSSSSTLTYTQAGVLRFSGGQGGRIDVGLNAANISNADLNVGTGVATFKGGVIISNSPGGVQVDNSSLVIGSGTNDNISGSDHCLIVGSNNQITSNSDQSVAFGQGNAITSSIDAFAVGNSNALTSSLRTQALGFNNTVSATSSFIAGGGNNITANTNIFALGDGHTVTGTTQDAYLLGTANTITGGTGSFAIGSNLDGDTGNHMVVGYRNNKTSYPTTNYSLGLGNTKFALAVGSTTTTNSNALLITEGGVNRGGGVAQVPRVLLPTVTGFSASNDAAADALGVPQGALYQNQGVVQINRGGGSTTDPLAGGGGGGIAGSLADEQVAFGNGTDTVAGTDDFTWNGNTLALGGSTGTGNFEAQLITGEAIKSNNYIDIADYVRHVGDTNTKFGFPATGNFTIDTGGSERMRIFSDGRVGIGISTIIQAQLDVKTTSTSSHVLRLNMPGTSSSQNGILIESNGSSATLQKFTQGISTRGSITFSGIGGVAYNTSSDYRVKENVTAIADGIERVKQLKPSKFNFIGSEQVVDGFIAHEVQGVIPEAIHGEKDATEEYEISPEVLDEEGNVLEEAVIGTKDKLQGIDQSKIVPLLTAALQEAIEKIETLEARVQALES